MAQRVETLASGLVLCETVPEAEPEAKQWCIECGKVPSQGVSTFFWGNGEFLWTRPTCKHRQYLLCRDCSKTYNRGCPVCGCREEYC